MGNAEFEFKLWQLERGERESGGVVVGKGGVAGKEWLEICKVKPQVYKVKNKENKKNNKRIIKMINIINKNNRNNNNYLLKLNN